MTDNNNKFKQKNLFDIPVTYAVNVKYNEADVMVDRTTKWGNPFKITLNTSRKEVLEKYKNYLWDCIYSDKITKKELAELYGKKLGCWCKPKPCHADLLAVAVDWAYQESN